jgi:hypothetical protein
MSKDVGESAWVWSLVTVLGVEPPEDIDMAVADWGVVGLIGEIGATPELLLLLQLLLATEGIRFHGGMTFLDERGCIVTSGRKTIVLDRFMILDFGWAAVVKNTAGVPPDGSDTTPDRPANIGFESS